METIRVINFILQSAFLVGSILFVNKLLKKTVHSPIWQWFVFFCVCVWLWVSGRFMETILYLFVNNNSFYVFAANYQYIGVTLAGSSYLIWNLYLASKNKLADNLLFRIFVFIIPVFIIIMAFTNSYHHLFYTKLVMGQRVSHGPLFAPLTISMYAILFAGLFVAVTDIVKKGEKVVLKIFIFSAIPLFPAIAVLARIVSGVDLLDVAPIVMGISYCCFYLLIFKYKYVNITVASIATVMAQTAHPVCIYDRGKKSFTYYNSIAQASYLRALDGIVKSEDFYYHASLLKNGKSCLSWESVYDAVYLKVTLQLFEDNDTYLITATDLTEYNRDIRMLREQISLLEKTSRELEEENVNIDAYIEALSKTQNLEYKTERISSVYELVSQAFSDMKNNFDKLLKDDANGEADTLLANNMELARCCLAEIRQTVGLLKE